MHNRSNEFSHEYRCIVISKLNDILVWLYVKCCITNYYYMLYILYVLYDNVYKMHVYS